MNDPKFLDNFFDEQGYSRLFFQVGYFITQISGYPELTNTTTNIYLSVVLPVKSPDCSHEFIHVDFWFCLNKYNSYHKNITNSFETDRIALKK